MKYEIAVDSFSNVRKIVEEDGTSTYDGGYVTQYKNDDSGSTKISQRLNGTKYYKDATLPTPAMRRVLPNVALKGNKRGFYAELIDDKNNVVSKEWYFTFQSELEMFNMYRSLQHPLPSGAMWDLFKSNVAKYRYDGSPEGYNYSCSVEVFTNGEIVLEWYMMVFDQEGEDIKNGLIYGV